MVSNMRTSGSCVIILNKIEARAEGLQSCRLFGMLLPLQLNDLLVENRETAVVFLDQGGYNQISVDTYALQKQ